MEAFQEQLSQQFQLPLQNPVLVFALILLIILLAPILLKRLKIPGIIGLIIAGVIVGPHGVNLLAQNSAVDLFSTIGLLYIMFIAGLELEMSEFRSNRNISLGFGALTFFLPLLLGFPTCYFLLGYDFTASLLIASMFSTHTMIAYPIVMKLGLSKDRSVAVTVGGTIITDTAVLLMLAFITGSHSGQMTSGFWIKLVVSMVLLLVVLFLLLPRMTRWFFTRMEGEKTSHYVFILAVVFLAAWFSQLAGLEPIIGAFVAGLALNRLVPQSSVLMNRIQFIGNALFIPFFLISIGMLVDLSVLSNGPQAIWVAVVLSTVALLGKFVAAKTTQWFFGFTKPQGLLIFGLSSSHAAATIAVILVGFRAGIIDENVLNGTIILILVTCLVASFATEKASKAILLQMTDTDRSPEGDEWERESILLPIAHMRNLESLLEFSLIVKEKTSRQPIRVLSVVTEPSKAKERSQAIKSNIENAINHFSLPVDLIENLTVFDQNIPAGINRASKEVGATSIILGWPTRETFSERIFGQKTTHLLESSDKSVFICQIRKPLNTLSRIVLFCPPYAEIEPGFRYAVRKAFCLARELNLVIQLIARPGTIDRISSIRETMAMPVTIKASVFVEWPELFDQLGTVSEQDIALILASRPGSVSYNPNMNQLAGRINDLDGNKTVILIYPTIMPSDDKYDKYRDFTAEPLTRSMEAFNRIQKGLGKMIQKAE